MKKLIHSFLDANFYIENEWVYRVDNECRVDRRALCNILEDVYCCGKSNKWYLKSWCKKHDLDFKTFWNATDFAFFPLSTQVLSRLLAREFVQVRPMQPPRMTPYYNYICGVDVANGPDIGAITSFTYDSETATARFDLRVHQPLQFVNLDFNLGLNDI